MEYGLLTADAIGFILKQILKRAMEEILNQRGTFEVFPKPNYAGVANADLSTTADEEAQKICARLLGEAFPRYGTVGEEGLLRVECTFEGRQIVITIDPLDGSKNYVRGEAFGVATMISMGIDGRIVAAYVGDVNTGDIYGYRPESPNVWRLRKGNGPFSQVNLAQLKRTTPLSEGYVLLRDERERYHSRIARVACSARLGGVFRAYTTASGSIGLSMARLWTDSVVAHAMREGHSTPWDDAPIVGIGKKLGMVWLRPAPGGYGFEEYEPVVPLDGPVERNHDAIVMHRSRVAAFHAAVNEERPTRFDEPS